MPVTIAWRVGLAVLLVIAIVASACVEAPRRRIPARELRELVICALGLYAIGGLASLTHHRVLAGLVYGAGIGVASLAAWLSRGRDGGDPPRGPEEPVDEQPPPQPDGLPTLDWGRFEREFRDYALRQRPPAAPPRRRTPSS